MRRIELSVYEANVIEACRDGIEVWGEDIAETLDEISLRQPVAEVLVIWNRGERHAQATAAGLRASRDALRDTRRRRVAL